VYDELNRLADKRLHASNYDGITPVALGASFNYLQSLDYTYNIRGWLTGINDAASCALQGGDQLADLFNMGLDYESTANGATAQFNGNIAAMQWRSNVNGSCLTRQQYRFTYDYANRLLTANHFTHNGTAWVNTNNYSESNITYDFNGNIKTYTRRGLTAPATFGIIDQLTYTYGDAARPDRLTNVSDAGSAAKGFKFTSGAAAYTYDLNGNLTQDNHKSLSFQYNYLNLPNYITNPGGSEITITYTADGEKLSKTSPTETRNYVSGIEYLGNALDAIYHREGRCTPNGSSAFYYEYTIKDHLGNARINFRANGAAVTFLQELHYYPFGMLMEGIGTAQVTNNGYKYNGKELNEDLGLNLSDYGARWYDASLGRWWSVDPLGDSMVSWSPYNYAFDSPLTFIDPDGQFPIETFWDIANVVYDVGAAIVNHAKGNHEAAKQNWIDGGLDLIATATPYVPAGLTKVAKVADNVVDSGKKADNAGEIVKEVKTFNGGQSTKSETSKEAFGKAKDANGIPRSQQPTKTIKPNTPEGDARGLDNRNVVEFDFTSADGTTISIRKDKAANYNSGGKGDQPPHYNAGKSGEKLRQHHYYKDKNARNK
jgi:RHS repeat-associated protein